MKLSRLLRRRTQTGREERDGLLFKLKQIIEIFRGFAQRPSICVSSTSRAGAVEHARTMASVTVPRQCWWPLDLMQSATGRAIIMLLLLDFATLEARLSSR